MTGMARPARIYAAISSGIERSVSARMCIRRWQGDDGLYDSMALRFRTRAQRSRRHS
jgi:hypothetical protein